MDPEKVIAITTWYILITKRQLQRFLGFANFYRRFIYNFSGLAGCLYELIGKTTEWTWDDYYQSAFERLKTCFTTVPVLRIYNWERQIVVETNISDWSLGGTLL